MKNHRWVWWVAVLLTGIFLFTRWYLIHTSLLFFIDIGRDANVMLTWKETLIPPLLGPQTSVLPINQSAWFFYLLMPGFLLTNGSPFSTIYSAALIYLAVFWSSLWLGRRELWLQRVVLSVWGLMILQPQFVIQNRFVWNPTFVAPAVLVALVGLYFFWQQRRWKWALMAGLGLASATGFSYSAAPVLVATALLSPLWFRKNWWQIWVGIAVGLAVVNAPTAFFELRHQFPLTRMLLTQKGMPQTETALQVKLHSLSHYSLMGDRSEIEYRLYLLLLGVLVLGCWSRWWSPADQKRRQVYTAGVALFGLTVVVLAIIPVSLLSHYVFGFVTLWLVLLAMLPWRLAVIPVALLVGYWLQPGLWQTYFAPAQRSVAQMQACYHTVCSEIKEPLFTSVQAGFHPFHAGQEARYLLRQAGCQVPEIDPNPQAANYMAVVVDGGEYEHGKTAYNELTQFGPSQEVKRFHCQENFNVVLLKKLATP